jgi:mycothiol synthase
MPEITVSRAESDAALQHTVDVYNAVHPDDAVTVVEARDYERQARDAASFAAELDGELAGAAHVSLPSYTENVHANVYVLAERRGRGVGRALYETVSDWAAARDGTQIVSYVDEGDDASLGWAERRGFVRHAWERYVELDLTAYEPQPPAPPPGVEIVTWAERPELARGIYEVACEAWPDIPGSDDERIEPFELFMSNHMQGSGDRPEGTFLAVAGAEVVGYAKFSFGTAMPDTLFHDLTGVKRAWRGRGIAGALKRTQVAWAKEQRYARLRTGNDDRNEPIRRLNAALGYRPVPGKIILKGPVLAARP